MTESPHDIENPSPAADPAASRRLFQGGVFALVAAIIYVGWTSGGDIELSDLLGLGILALAFLPALLWAKRQRTWFPAFEISMLTCVAFYAVPLFGRHGELAEYPSGITVQAAFLVILYLGAANFGFSLVRSPARPRPWATGSLLPDAAQRHVHAGIWANTAYIYLSDFTPLIPPEVDSILRAFFFGIGTISAFVLCRLWGLGILDRGIVAVVVINLIAQSILIFSTLYLIGGISLLALSLISYASARRRIPWAAIVAVLPVLALLHLGKSEMRRIHWAPGAPSPALSDLPAFYTEWVGCSLEAREAGKRDPSAAGTSIFARASLIQMLCLSIDNVPDRKPYLWGESYIDIPAQIIPRFLWPDKPSSLLANIRLARYFNLVTVDNAFTVSIAFGTISEAYINFGFVGVALLGLLMGMGFKRVSMLADGAPQFSALGIFMILLTAWSFQIEQVMSTWLSSLFQACIVCIGAPLAYRRFTEGR